MSREVTDDVVRARGKVECGFFPAYGSAVFTPRYECPVFDEKRHGMYRWWRLQQLTDETWFVDDNEHGIARGWHRNGSLAYEHTYVNGKMCGLWKSWRENGECRQSTCY